MAHKTRSFCFTVNNYSEETISELKQLKNYKYMVLGKEIAPSTGTPHLQSFVYMKTPIRLSNMIKLLNDQCKSVKHIHVEQAFGTNQQAIEYCKKDKSANDIIEYGIQPVDKSVNLTQNKNKSIIEDIKQGKQLKQIIEENEGLYLRYGNNFHKMYEMFKPKYSEQLIELRPWQQQLIETVNNHPNNDRTIHWVYDPVGNNGKTVLSHHLLANNYIKLKNGKSADIAMAWNGENVIFDFSRSQEDHINYDIIESLKDGYVFSSKYESKCKHFNKPILIVFANFKPDYKAVSYDRWQIYTIKESQLINITENEYKYHMISSKERYKKQINTLKQQLDEDDSESESE